MKTIIALIKMPHWYSHYEFAIAGGKGSIGIGLMPSSADGI